MSPRASSRDGSRVNLTESVPERAALGVSMRSGERLSVIGPTPNGFLEAWKAALEEDGPALLEVTVQVVSRAGWPEEPRTLNLYAVDSVSGWAS